MDTAPKKTFVEWTKQLDANALNIWREAMAQLRQLHGDVWNGVRFFWSLNGIVIAGVFALWPKHQTDLKAAVTATFLLGIGIALTRVGLLVLRSHRSHYVDMMLRKTLIEIELGFTNQLLRPDVPIAFPWRADKTDDATQKPQQWVREYMFPRPSIVNTLRRVYVAFIIVDAFLIAATWACYLFDQMISASAPLHCT